MVTSIQTTIFGIVCFHCVGGDEEHYCVDANGYIAIHNMLLKEKFHVKTVKECGDMMVFNKLTVYYNPKLDGGLLHDGTGTNSKGCRATDIFS